MAAPSASAPFVRAGLVAVLVALVWWATAETTSMPPVWPLGPQPTYTGVDSPALVALEPVLHAAWLDAPSGPVVALAAMIVVLGASGVALFAGASTLAAILVLTALVLDTAFSAALSHAARLTFAVGLVWLAAGAALDDRSQIFVRRRWLHPLCAMLLWAAAVWWYWIAVITWPLVLSAIRRTPQRPMRGAWTIGSLLLGAAAFVAHFAWMAHAAQAVTVGSGSLGWRDALRVAFDARPWMPFGSYTAPELTTRLGYLLMALAVLGVIFGSIGTWWRRTVLLTAALAIVVALTWSEWQAEVVRFSLWALAPLSAVGLTWVASQGRRSVLITIVLGALAVTETVALGARPLDGGEARLFRDNLAAALAQRADTSLVAVVAEDTRIDSGLVPWIAGRTPRVVRVTQDGGAAAAALREGRIVLAGPAGRRHLELAGLSFGEASAVMHRVSFPIAEADHALQCATIRADRWSQLPGLEFTGRFGIRVPPGVGGELQLIIGDALALPLRAETPGERTIELRQESLSSGPGVSPPPADYWFDYGAPSSESGWIHRVRLPADPLVASLVSIELGRRAPRAIARLIGYGDEARGRVCAAPLGSVHLREAGAEALSLREETLFGAGWYGLEGRGSGAFRWADSDAIVLVRSALRADVEVTLEASAAAATGPSGATSVSLRVNGVDVGAKVAGDAPRFTWRVPAGVWVAGTNELWWTTTRAVRPADTGGADTRSLALRVTGISLTRK